MKAFFKAIILIVVTLLVLFAIISIFGGTRDESKTDPFSKIKNGILWLKEVGISNMFSDIWAGIKNLIVSVLGQENAMKIFGLGFDINSLSKEALLSKIRSGELILLDVREQSEYNEGHIPGAKLLPLGNLETKAAAELPDKNTMIALYCRTGVRSAAAKKILDGLGYKNVIDIGGINKWTGELEK